MKILMVNKFFYIKGGSETYYFSLKKLLETHGHTVIDFSMQDERNFNSDYKEYFVDNIDYSGKHSLASKLHMASNIIYSLEAKQKFRDLIESTEPDLIHLHIFQHQLSPSILDVIKKYDIPVVYTAHDLKMVCLNYKMMHHETICEDCKGEKYYKCAVNKCVKDSFSKSCINVIEGYFHKWRQSYDIIDEIITPSSFYRSKFIEFGIRENKVHHIPNFLDATVPTVNKTPDSKQYYLYFGRLSEEKGVLTLIKALEETHLSLYIVGTGPLLDQLAAYITEKEINNIHLLGFKNGQELTDIVGNAKAVILPSEWYENGPYSAIEALRLGRPIIGSDIGGIPELVSDNGYLFKTGDSDSLKNAITAFDALDSEAYAKCEQASLELFFQNYTQTTHYNALFSIYTNALDAHKNQ